ncbi:unannotated protein [freshwater metagenome]|uniref:Unannotated protein n=1 Tax=freshwater metagenome TaxID=449393 RepID=A0A6J7SIP2_9ZZZZ
MTRQKLLLLDGHSLAYRAFYGLPPENFTTSSGQVTNAVYGFTTMFINLMKDEKPTHVAVAFDVSRVTFRTEVFPEYKATRAATPAEFKGQVELIRDVLTALNVKSLAIPGFEADDIIATLKVQADAHQMDIVISTGDRDSFQLIDDHTTVLYPRKGVSDLVRMTPAALEEKYGLTPLQYPDYAALRGDPSDNLPGIPGVGEKTAAKWIQEYGSLSKLLESREQVPGKVGIALREAYEQVRLNRDLTALRHDVPLEYSIVDLLQKPAESTPVHEIFDLLEFKALRERVKPLLIVGEQILETSRLISTRTSVDLVGSAIAVRGERMARTSNAGTEVGTLAEFKEWLSNESEKKIAHNAKSLMHTLHGYDISGVYRDTAISAYLVNPGQKVEDLSELCERYLGYPVETESDELALDLDGTDGPLIAEAEAVLALAKVLEPEIERAGLTELDNTLEMPLTALLYRMESVGVAVSRQLLAELSGNFASIAQRASEDGASMVGHEVNLASPKQLQVVLFDELNLPKTKKNKTGFTTDSDAIDWLRTQSQHPFLEIIRNHRDFSKLKSIVEGLERAIADDGRIHTTLAQTVTATGRLSSVDPNLQNIPVRTEEGRKIRAAFIAGEGFESLLTADYSQIEMRIMAHLSKDAGLIAAFASGEDLHTTVACQVFSVDATAVTPEMRRQIKAMSYGLAYGLSAYGLAGQLGISDGDARNLMENYFERFGGVRDYLREVVVEARKKGYTETLLGRKRFLPDLASDNRQRREMAERMALNAPIQGTAADIVKLAMLAVDRELSAAKLRSRLLLQVHDELIIEVAPGEVDRVREIVTREMEGAYLLDVTLDVNVGIGKNWDEGAH